MQNVKDILWVLFERFYLCWWQLYDAAVNDKVNFKTPSSIKSISTLSIWFPPYSQAFPEIFSRKTPKILWMTSRTAHSIPCEVILNPSPGAIVCVRNCISSRGRKLEKVIRREWIKLLEGGSVRHACFRYEIEKKQGNVCISSFVRFTNDIEWFQSTL